MAMEGGFLRIVRISRDDCGTRRRHPVFQHIALSCTQNTRYKRSTQFALEAHKHDKPFLPFFISWRIWMFGRLIDYDLVAIFCPVMMTERDKSLGFKSRFG
jgi:hypothetical protein